MKIKKIISALASAVVCFSSVQFAAQAAITDHSDSYTAENAEASTLKPTIEVTKIVGEIVGEYAGKIVSVKV